MIPSAESLLLTLLFLVPGGLGEALRDWIFAGSRRTAAQEALRALATSVFSLVLLEVGTAALSIFGEDFDVGDFFVRDLLTARAEALDVSAVIGKYFMYFFLALALPSLGAALLRRKRVSRLFRSLGFLHRGFDAAFDEDWEGKPQVGVWVVVETDDDRTFRGGVAWRGTNTDPADLVLYEVCDVTDPSAPKDVRGLLFLPEATIRRVRLLTQSEWESEIEPREEPDRAARLVPVAVAAANVLATAGLLLGLANARRCRKRRR